MGVSEQDRRERLLDLLGVAAEHKTSSAALGGLAMRNWALRRATAQDYIDDLVAMGYLILRPDGSVEVTKLGHAAVLDLPPVKAPRVRASEVPTPPEHPVSPSPPSSSGEVAHHDDKNDNQPA